MKILELPNIPPPAGHYSSCVEHNGVLYLSGILPKHQDDGTIPDGVEAQTRLVLENMKAILEAAGSSQNHVIRVRLYIPNVEMWDEVNAVYADFFGDHKPARVVVPSRDLHYGALVELEVTAAAV